MCRVGVKSKGALLFHLKSFHLASRTYHCSDCDSTFNNAADLAGHVWSTHSKKKVSCKHCLYKMTLGARMQIHVWIHTSGMCCKMCGQSYPNSRSLCEHAKLHVTRTTSVCTTCEKSFAMEYSLRIHIKGKHGDGYRCVCGLSFSSPVQRAHHRRNCSKKE